MTRNPSHHHQLKAHDQQVWLLSGGAASGKSQFATEILRQVPEVVVFGTNQIRDPLMSEKLEKLQKSRPESWQTVSVQCELCEAIDKNPGAGILVDSINQWLASIIVSRLGKASEIELLSQIEHEILSITQTLEKREGPAIIVTAELGTGPSPPQKAAQLLRIALGRSNQTLASFADKVISLQMGLPQVLKP